MHIKLNTKLIALVQTTEERFVPRRGMEIANEQTLPNEWRETGALRFIYVRDR